MSREIERSAYAAQRRIENSEDVIVGLNRFEEGDEVPSDLFEHDLTEQDRQCRELADLRASRDAEAVDRTLAALKEACQGTDNLMLCIGNPKAAYKEGDKKYFFSSYFKKTRITHHNPISTSVQGSPEFIITNPIGHSSGKP